jgi:hypothetical protein
MTNLSTFGVVPPAVPEETRETWELRGAFRFEWQAQEHAAELGSMYQLQGVKKTIRHRLDAGGTEAWLVEVQVI